MSLPQIILSETDHARLTPLLHDTIVRGDTPRYLTDALRAKLKSAQVVSPKAMPADVVTMNSLVVVRDFDDDQAETYVLVYPTFANIAEGNLSVLTPIGAAVLGERKGATGDLKVPFGTCRIRIEDVQFQPESVGQYDV